MKQVDTNGSATLRESYERLRSEGLALLDGGELAAAHARFQEALEVARELEEPRLVDTALCNRAAVAIALGDVERSLPELRKILARNLCADNCALAAHNLSWAYAQRQDHEKSLFYARIACDRAQNAKNAKWLAPASNQLGNALLATSKFDEAAETYLRALALVPAGLTDWQLVCLVNLGYCQIVRGHRREGLTYVYRVLRAARARRLKRLEMIARVDLCYAYLDSAEAGRAVKHGERGLSLAEEVGEVDWIKNALYLMGEVAVLDGRSDDAEDYFTTLQSRYYPNQPYLPLLLLTVDVRQMVNLRA
jgi:tetratricopeptide (TPR) repeat protein